MCCSPKTVIYSTLNQTFVSNFPSKFSKQIKQELYPIPDDYLSHYPRIFHLLSHQTETVLLACNLQFKSLKELTKYFKSNKPTDPATGFPVNRKFSRQGNFEI